MVLAAIPFGLAIGFAVATLGGGGSVLAVPVFVYVLGENVQQATTASLVVVLAAALAGGLRHNREGRVCWRHAGVFTAAAVPGIVAGTAAGDAVAARTLLGAFGVVMLLAAYATWRKADAPGSPEESLALCPPLRMARDVSAGLGIGLLTGFFGVGGGFLIVPTLAIVLAFAMRSAIGTSLAIITATSVLGLVAHLAAGRTIDVGVTTAMTAACVVGALVGADLSGRIPQRTLGRAFAVLVTAVGAYLLVSGAIVGSVPSSA
jgi:hypothetical protein